MKIKNRQQSLVVVTLACVGLFAADKLLINPLTARWHERSDRINALRKQVSEGKSLLQRERGLRAHWTEMQTNTLPANRSLAEQKVLKAFDRWAQETQVTVTSIVPQTKQDADNYMTLECRVEAAGNLSGISHFLYSLERDPMALKLQSVELSARDNDGQQFALGLQVSGLILTAQEQP
jgi:hypothetical protein